MSIGLNQTGIKAAMRTANASWFKMVLVNTFGKSYYVDDLWMDVQVHYKLYNGQLYFIDFR